MTDLEQIAREAARECQAEEAAPSAGYRFLRYLGTILRALERAVAEERAGREKAEQAVAPIVGRSEICERALISYRKHNDALCDQVEKLKKRRSRALAAEREKVRRLRDIVEAAQEEVSDHCSGDGGPCNCNLCAVVSEWKRDAALAETEEGKDA